ncbi:hypothetical protein RJ639_006289 [Escallonia herrerae]|uniref:Protein kinase domain-containing protein n=1 Tax=Escallonia herrerae TaxID=1293975 RepID=A0AA88VWU6_9ASTE|nr:hypothetical protein RJ639_006289 [Escallonia herrerae]
MSEIGTLDKEKLRVVVRIKVVAVAPAGAVAAEAKSKAANWVILDKKLKKERYHCMEELRCNIVVMKGSRPKVLRLSLKCPNEIQTPFFSAASSPGLDAEASQGHRMKHSTPIGSPEEPSTSFTLSSEEKSLSSFGLDTVTPLFSVYERNPLFEGLNRGRHTPTERQNGLVDPITALGSSGERIITLSITPKVQSDHKRVFWIPETHAVDGKPRATKNSKNTLKIKPFVQCNQDILTVVPKLNQSLERDNIFSSSIREAVSLGRTSSIPPPLCSLCQHKAPAFGKPPRQFAYQELEEATDEFSDMNFLAEGGFGLVHRGVLKDGKVVAVKQLKFAGSKGDADFCREMRVLSYAQHQNVVLLIGFCIERKKRVLVYEFICNGSLDIYKHGICSFILFIYLAMQQPCATYNAVLVQLFDLAIILMRWAGNERTPLDWHSRLKIATGTARGLRYLHEDCRVGCIIHRDMRPNNIFLLTHDFEPLVGDFGLVKLHNEWDFCDEERVTGTSGYRAFSFNTGRYLAPEYFNGGKITEKVDVYAFGLVLLELITGRKTSDLQCQMGQHFLSEYFYPLAALEPIHHLAYKHQLLDPCLASYQFHDLPYELQAMGRAASLCLQQDPVLRPPMSKVLRMLEGGDASMPLGLDLNLVGSRSGHMRGLVSSTQIKPRRKHSRRLSH